MDIAGGIKFVIIVCLAGVVNLSIILLNFFYANSGDVCVTTIADGISFNLSTWLQVDAYIRIVTVSFVILLVLEHYCFQPCLYACEIFVYCFFGLYALFSVSWTIVGSVLFWGKLNPTGICQGQVQLYMYVLLTYTYTYALANCLSGK